MPFASWQTSLQNVFPSAGTQLQEGWAHFGDVFTDRPFKSALKLASHALCQRGTSGRDIPFSFAHRSK